MSQPSVDALTDLSGRVALVTGASGGIGEVVAARLAEAGAEVAVHHRGGGGERVAAELRERGERATAFAADLGDPDAPQRLLEEVRADLGPIDTVVACAAIQPVTPLPEVDVAEWDELVAINLRAPFRMLQRAAALADGATVIHVVSVEAWQSLPGHTHYGAAKAALAQLTRAAAAELGPRVRVNAVAPGLTWRPGLSEAWPEGVDRWTAAAPSGRLVDPHEVADAVLSLAAPALRGASGVVLPVDGGMSAVAPW